MPSIFPAILNTHSTFANVVEIKKTFCATWKVGRGIIFINGAALLSWIPTGEEEATFESSTPLYLDS